MKWTCQVCKNPSNSIRDANCKICGKEKPQSRYGVMFQGNYYLCLTETDMDPTMSIINLSENDKHEIIPLILISDNIKECVIHSLEINAKLDAEEEDIDTYDSVHTKLSRYGTVISSNPSDTANSPLHGNSLEDSGRLLYNDVLEQGSKLMYDSHIGRFIDIRTVNSSEFDKDSDRFVEKLNYVQSMEKERIAMKKVIEEALHHRSFPETREKFNPPKPEDPRKECGICCQVFPTASLLGQLPFKTIIEWRKKNNAPIQEDIRFDPKRVYDVVPICLFCLQFFDKNYGEVTDNARLEAKSFIAPMDSPAAKFQMEKMRAKKAKQAETERQLRLSHNINNEDDDGEDSEVNMDTLQKVARPMSRLQLTLQKARLKMRYEGSHNVGRYQIYSKRNNTTVVDNQYCGTALRNKYKDLASVENIKKRRIMAEKTAEKSALNSLSTRANDGLAKKNIKLSPERNNTNSDGIGSCTFITTVASETSTTGSNTNPFRSSSASVLSTRNAGVIDKGKENISVTARPAKRRKKKKKLVNNNEIEKKSEDASNDIKDSTSKLQEALEKAQETRIKKVMIVKRKIKPLLLAIERREGAAPVFIQAKSKFSKDMKVDNNGNDIDANNTNTNTDTKKSKQRQRQRELLKQQQQQQQQQQIVTDNATTDIMTNTKVETIPIIVNNSNERLAEELEKRRHAYAHDKQQGEPVIRDAEDLSDMDHDIVSDYAREEVLTTGDSESEVVHRHRVISIMTASDVDSVEMRSSKKNEKDKRSSQIRGTQSEYSDDIYEYEHENDYDDDFEQDSEPDDNRIPRRRDSFNTNSDKYGHPIVHTFSNHTQSRPHSTNSRPHSHNGINQELDSLRMSIEEERSGIEELADDHLQNTLSKIEQLSFSWGQNQERQELSLHSKRKSKPKEERKYRPIEPHRYSSNEATSPSDQVRYHSSISASPVSVYKNKSTTKSSQLLEVVLGTPSPLGTADSSYRGRHRGSATGSRPQTYECEALSPVNTAPRRGSAAGSRPQTYESEGLSPVNIVPSVSRRDSRIDPSSYEQAPLLPVSVQASDKERTRIGSRPGSGRFKGDTEEVHFFSMLEGDSDFMSLDAAPLEIQKESDISTNGVGDSYNMYASSSKSMKFGGTYPKKKPRIRKQFSN